MRIVALDAWHRGKPVAPTHGGIGDFWKLLCYRPGSDIGYYKNGSGHSYDCVLVRVRKDCTYRAYPTEPDGSLPRSAQPYDE